MRLDFNVLWVDDQPDRVEAQITAIKRQMAGQGFEFRPSLCQTVADIKVQIADDVFNDEVDLILVDWDLGGHLQGQDAIAEVRTSLQYKDVILYSALKTSDELRRLAFESGLEGIYCAQRTDLVDEVVGVFESLVKKVLDLDHTRGIVMGATSDIDHVARNCLSAIHSKLDSASQVKLVNDALKRINTRIKSLQKIAGRLASSECLDEILKAHMLFTANDGLRMLSSELTRMGPDASKHRVDVVNYIKEIVPRRNTLGHQVLSPEGRPIAIGGDRGETIRVDDMRQLRCRLLELRNQFRSLFETLSSGA